MTTPEHKQISKALTALQNDKDGPVFVHCKRGADRTGVVLEVYRINMITGRTVTLSGKPATLACRYQIPLQRYITSYQRHARRDKVVEGGSTMEKLMKLPGLSRRSSDSKFTVFADQTSIILQARVVYPT
jgi:hypothetical protein